MFLRLLTCVLLSASLPAFAGGRLTAQINDFEGGTRVYPMLGLSIDQTLMWGLHANTWMGWGQRPVEDGTKDWATMKLGFDYYFARVAVGAGVFHNVSWGASGEDFDFGGAGAETGAFAKASLKLW